MASYAELNFFTDKLNLNYHYQFMKTSFKKNTSNSPRSHLMLWWFYCLVTLDNCCEVV